MITRISETVHGVLGWCPDSNVQMPRSTSGAPSSNVPDPDVPDPGDYPVGKAGFPDGLTVVAIVTLFATLFFGGNFWWPFFVGAVLVACLAYRYFHASRGVC